MNFNIIFACLLVFFLTMKGARVLVTQAKKTQFENITLLIGLHYFIIFKVAQYSFQHLYLDGSL